MLCPFKKKQFKDVIYLFLERGEGREKEWERTIDVPQPGTEPTTQACALTRNWTRDLLFYRMVPSQLAILVRGMSVFSSVIWSRDVKLPKVPWVMAETRTSYHSLLFTICAFSYF